MTPRFVSKTGWFWSTLHWALVILSFGQQRNFLIGYATTIGPWIALPESWFLALRRGTPPGWLRRTVEHELVHYRQFKAAGLGHPVVGIVPLGLVYLLLPLPLGFAWCRWRLELPAYVRQIQQLLAELHVDSEITPEQVTAARRSAIDWAVRELTGPKYLWTMPFKKHVRGVFESRL
jgi:hypothetical protein